MKTTKKIAFFLLLLCSFVGYSQNNPTSTQATDWNSTRSNKTSKTTRVSNPNGNNPPQPIQATDWNSTRSNKTSKTTRAS
ncbi:MAG TPA: hypothetical protein ENK85_04780, partial [Saprospiraceae bacterium]|nr:hypothetical protein [Saprospiraceae bacterium]